MSITEMFEQVQYNQCWKWAVWVKSLSLSNAYLILLNLCYVKLSVVDRHSFGPKISKCRNESSASNTHFRMSCSEGLWLRGFIGTSWLLYLVVNVLECTYLLATKISTIIGYIIITATTISKVPCCHIEWDSNLRRT